MKDLRRPLFLVVVIRHSVPLLTIVVIRNDEAMQISASPADANSNSRSFNDLHQTRSLLMFATPGDAHHYTETRPPFASPADFLGRSPG
jgi:hypothetical protein